MKKIDKNKDNVIYKSNSDLTNKNSYMKYELNNTFKNKDDEIVIENKDDEIVIENKKNKSNELYKNNKIK